jgi:hypothetical protein
MTSFTEQFLNWDIYEQLFDIIKSMMKQKPAEIEIDASGCRGTCSWECANNSLEAGERRLSRILFSPVAVKVKTYDEICF